MPIPSAPFKTPEGVAELRHRTRGLGQRHRTVLLLVDGRRPLGEVLGMALKAGAATSHLEDLVRLGLVEVPAEGMAPEPQETAPGALDVPRLTSVEVEVLPTEEIELPVLLDAAWEVTPPAEASPAPTAAEVTFEMPHDDGPDKVGNPDVAPVEVPALTAPPPPAPEPSPRPPPAPRQRAKPKDTAAPSIADHARPRAQASEESLRHQVRSLLVGAMGAEAAIFAPLTLTRIRTAQTQRDLIGLVWELERHRNHLRRSRAQLLSLEKARELLGMGNTLVAGDSGHGAVWPDTQGN